MKKVLLVVFVLFALSYLVACQTTKTTIEETTTTISKPPVIPVTSKNFNLNLTNYLVRTIKLEDAFGITDGNNISLAKSNKLFMKTPLQNKFIDHYTQINNLILDLQGIGNEVLQNVVFYEDQTYDFNTLSHVSVINSDFDLVDTNLTPRSLHIKLQQGHWFLSKYNLSNELLEIKIQSNTNSLSIQAFEQVDQSLFSFQINLETKEFEMMSRLGDITTLNVHMEEDYQIIEIDQTTQDDHQQFFFYGNNLNSAIYHVTEQGNDLINDYEVYRYGIGLFYKSLSTRLNNVSKSINGYTLNCINNWKSFTKADSILNLQLVTGNYQHSIKTNYLEINESKYVRVTDSVAVVNINDNLYNNTPYYLVGYFMEADDVIDGLNQIDVSTIATPEILFYSSYISSVKTLTNEMNRIIGDPTVTQLNFVNLISEVYDSSKNIYVSVIKKEETTNVVVLNQNHELVNRYNINGEVKYQDGLLFVYGTDGIFPYLSVKKLDEGNNFIQVHEYSFNYLTNKIITDVVYNSNQLTVSFNEENSSYSNKMIIDLLTHQTQIVYSSIKTTFIDPVTNTKVNVVVNDDNILLLLIYNPQGQLTDVTTGETSKTMNVLLDQYKIQNNKLMLYGSNNEKPYLYVPAFNETNRIDSLNTVSYTYYIKGTITNVDYDVTNVNYKIEMVLEDQSTVTIHVNKTGEVGALVKLGYLTDWSNWSPDDPKFAKITHINYSFAILGDQMGTVTESFARAQNIIKLKQNNPHLKVSLAIGGWGTTWFSEAAATDNNRKQFARTAIEIMKKYGMDGIDLDWEYPARCTGGITCDPANDKRNFTLLLKQIRDDLNVLSQTTGEKYVLSYAAGGFMGDGSNTELREVIKYVDFINVMTYDLEKWVTGGKNTSHQSHLYTSVYVPVGSPGGDFWLQRFIDNGVPANKLNLGAAFYGRGAKGITVTGEVTPAKVFDKFFTTQNGLTYTYSRIKNELLTSSNYVRYWDDSAKNPWLYNQTEGIFLSYEDPQSIQAKMNYVKDNHLGGIFFWEFTQDSTGDLINAIDLYSR